LSEERARSLAPTATVKILTGNRRFMVLSRPERQLAPVNPIALAVPDTIVADVSIERRGGNQ